MNIDISWKLASKGGKADPKNDVTSSYEGIYIAVHMIQTRYSGMKRSIKYFYNKCGTKRPGIIRPGLSIYCKGLKHKGTKLVQDIGLACYRIR